MRYHLRSVPLTGIFPYAMITRTPTVTEVRDMASRLQFAPEVVLKSEHYLSIMLCGKRYTEGNADLVIRQFHGGDDPYEYYRFVKGLERSYTDTQRSKGWLKNVARLLICWVAEELRTIGIGNGFPDHFTISGVRTDVPHVMVPPQAPPPPQAAPQAPPPPPPQAPPPSYATASPVQYATAETYDTDAPPPPTVVVHSSWAPPPYDVRVARTVAANENIMHFLRRGANAPDASKRKRRDETDYATMNHPDVFKKIRWYLENTAEGRRVLEMSQVTIDSYTLDHVVSRDRGGPDVAWNCHIMPMGANSHFGNRDWRDDYKRAYVGEKQFRLVECAMQRMRTHPVWGGSGSND